MPLLDGGEGTAGRRPFAMEFSKSCCLTLKRISYLAPIFRAYATDAGETLEKAAAISQGFDARMKHKVVPTNGQNGK